ncbi:MAG: hypothetical protein GY811_24850 [Myxococcales bacterium]|nr:hypothetical protein [Myxococcales bacterium]
MLDRLSAASRRLAESDALAIRLRDEIEQWKLAAGLLDGSGDPGDITPTHLREGLGILAIEAERERSRKSLNVGASREGKPANTIEDCNRIMSELEAMVPALEESKSTRPAARYLRTILGMAPQG